MAGDSGNDGDGSCSCMGWITNIFKSRNKARQTATYGENERIGRIFRGDEDWGPYVAEPDINDKADAFIFNFHRTRTNEMPR